MIQLLEQAARLRDALRRVFDRSRVIQQDLADHLPRVSPRIDVVAHERHALAAPAVRGTPPAVGRARPPESRSRARARRCNRTRHLRRQARADRPRAGSILDSPNSPAIARAAATGAAARSMPVKRLSGKWYASGIRLAPLPQPISSTRQAGYRRGPHAEQPGDRRQPVRVCLPPREGAIRNLIVGVIHRPPSGTSCPPVRSPCAAHQSR